MASGFLCVEATQCPKKPCQNASHFPTMNPFQVMPIFRLSDFRDTSLHDKILLPGPSKVNIYFVPLLSII